MKNRLPRKWVVLPLLLTAIVVSGDLIALHFTYGKSEDIKIVPLENPSLDVSADQLKVMTINMAHGRANGMNQMLQSDQYIKDTVSSIGRMIARERVQVIAMQEADASSWWSGNFSHVNMVGKLGGMTSAIQGLNVNGLGLAYGAAIVTQLDASNARQVTFEKNIPTFSKGFVVVTCKWPGDATFEFDVVSLHLDFANKRVREKQLTVLSDLIKNTAKPIILMGDFNTDMSEQLLPSFLKESRLSTWKADDESIVTFPFMGTRIDWIFVSEELRLVEQSVLDDVLSDHKILTATIERAL